MKRFTIVLMIVLVILLVVGCTNSGDSINQKENNLEKEKNSEIDVKEGVLDEIQHLKDGTPYLLHPDNIRSGGPPKDGIPSIDNPQFETVARADNWLNDEDLVLGLNYGGVQRAYALRILNWHEIVNDEIDGERVLITYCPLCRTGIAFDPTVDDEQVEFGVSGKLYNSEIIMYDRKTDSYWTQTLGKAILGDATGQVLEKIPLDTVRWVDWKNTHPNSEVLSRNTGEIRDYDRSPYGDYDTSSRLFFPVDNEDDRLHEKELIFGVDLNGDQKAYTEKIVEEEMLISDEVGGVPIIVVWDGSLNTVKILERTHNGQELTFALNGIEIKDNNDVTWTVNQMVDELPIVDTFGHFWFAWAAFFPETELYGG